MFCSQQAMRLFLLGTISCALLSVAAANPSPMTPKDVSLMLRSGFSGGDVEKELTTRHFIGAVDATAEKNLVEAGATPALIQRLKSGAFAVPASEAAALKTDLAAKEQRRAAQAEESRKLDTLYQAQLAQARAKAAASGVANPGSIAAAVKGALVTSRNGILSPHPDAEFEKKKLIGLYFSAYWCGPCRKFTPSLVEYYNKTVTAHPEFEIVFISHDKTGAAMEGYMRDMHMPWPAVTFDKVAGSEALTKYAGSGIPCLVVVDENGKVISDSFAGKTYRGPEAVLTDLDQLFAGKSPAQVAQAR
jgi:nucleoredoxin